MIKQNDFQALWKSIENEILDSVKQFGKSGWYILGQGVIDFEHELTKFYPDNKYAIGCASGLDAIEIGLMAMGLKPGDIVLTTPLSAFATTLAIIKCGGIPAFVDIEENGLINLDLVEQYLTKNPNVKYFVPVHLYGHALNLEKLQKIKKKFNLKIVEDCAQSICAKSFNKSVGSVGDVAATSFYPTKNLGCFGDGGALLTSSEDINIKARSIRDYGQSSKYNHTIIGMNSRLDELQAIIMKNVLLPRLNEATQHRKEIANIYLNGIKNKNITIPQKPIGSDSVYHLFPILCQSRDKLKEYLKNNEVESGIHYPILITDQPALKNIQHIVYKGLTNAKKFVTEELSLPINPTVTKEEAQKIVNLCNNWVN
jgi:dTDP-3-amino-3,4,6-trideoxy-alpha-D-glucose transaminase